MRAEELLYRLLKLRSGSIINFVGDPNDMTFPTVYAIRSLQPGLFTDTSTATLPAVPMGFVFGDPTDYKPNTNSGGYPVGNGWTVWDPYAGRPNLARTAEESLITQTSYGWSTFLQGLLQHPKPPKYETYYTYFDFTAHLPQDASPDSSVVILAAFVDDEHSAITFANVVFMREESLQFGDWS